MENQVSRIELEKLSVEDIKKTDLYVNSNISEEIQNKNDIINLMMKFQNQEISNNSKDSDSDKKETKDKESLNNDDNLSKDKEETKDEESVKKPKFHRKGKKRRNPMTFR